MMPDFIQNFIQNHPKKIQFDPWTTNSHLVQLLSTSVKRERYIYILSRVCIAQTVI